MAREEADLWQRRLVDQTSASEKLVEQLRGEGAGRRKEMEHIFENLRTSERRRVAAEQELMAAKSKANEEVAQGMATAGVLVKGAHNFPVCTMAKNAPCKAHEARLRIARNAETS